MNNLATLGNMARSIQKRVVPKVLCVYFNMKFRIMCRTLTGQKGFDIRFHLLLINLKNVCLVNFSSSQNFYETKKTIKSSLR